MTIGRTWTVEQDTPDQSTDHEDATRLGMMATYSDVTKPSHARADNRIRTSSEVRRDAARYRGTAHPLCFMDEVLDYEFPEGFKPVNIESYDGTTDPS